MQKIVNFLIFNGEAEKAMNFYVSLFSKSRVTTITRCKFNEAGKERTIMHASFTLNGQQFMCIDSPAKHSFGFMPSLSLYINCESDAEIEELFKRLSDRGSVLTPLSAYPFSKKYGWVNDKFLCIVATGL